MITDWRREGGRRRRWCGTLLLLCAVGTAASAARAHFFVATVDRVADSPPSDGSGWLAQVWLDLPDAWAGSLLTAEAYVREHPADFTFRTTHIDFPSGPTDSVLDSELASIGALLDGNVFDVSDATQLSRPMGHCLMRFSGLINVRLADSTLGINGLPILLDLGTQAFGGHRTRVGVTSIYRVQGAAFTGGSPFFTENALVQAVGLFPIQVTYLNRHAPAADNGDERAGIELYSWHPGGLPWPAGVAATLPEWGPMTITPPAVIYQPADVPPAARGDVDGDGAVSLRDYQGLQLCAGGDVADGGDASVACANLDFDGDGAINAGDVPAFGLMLSGPGQYAYLPGDFNADRRVDLADYGWMQRCLSAGGGDDEARALLATGCGVFDVNGDDAVDWTDFIMLQPFFTGSARP